MQVISREEAKAAGLKVFFTGIPCKHGHISPRYVIHAGCKECAVQSALASQARNPENAAEANKKKHLKMRSTRPEQIAQYTRRYYPKAVAHVRKRQATKLNATPKWLTEEHHQQIFDVYQESHRLSAETGIPHHVDHVIPLQGEKVCGLHVPWNLRAIPAEENLRKSNKVEEDA